MIENLLKYFHTIRFLKIGQIIWRLLKLFKSTDISAPKLVNQRDLVNNWHQFITLINPLGLKIDIWDYF